jgi:hypothetical protein
MSDARAKDPLAKVEPSAAITAGATKPQAAPAEDVVLIGPPTADGAGVHVLRAREERIEAGELRGIQEGKPITGEIVTLQPREDNPRVCDVKQSYAPPTTASLPLGHKGPANVASEAYREGWDEIFGAKPPSRDLN